MRYLVLAADYDGTLAHHGRVDDQMLDALVRLKESGRRLVMVTGRELDELLEVCPRIDLFDRVVAENGAVLYRPETREERTLGERPSDAFVAALRDRGVDRISVGRVIVATWEPHQDTVLDVIRTLGLELQVIFNKGAVMVLPSGLNKATGLAAALDELGISPHNAVGVGDAENDHAFLSVCECSVAVANALPSLKDRADMVTVGDHGTGVAQVVDKLMAEDLADLAPRLERHAIPLGKREDGGEERIPPYGVNVLIAGMSGGGKSTLTTGLLERLADRGYQYLVVDPEGDYETLEGAVVLGDPRSAPTVDEVLDLIAPPRLNAVVNLLGIPLADRPAFFMGLLPHLQELRARTGRPHWIVVDETHHLLPAEWDPASLTLPQELRGMLFITVHPESMAPPALRAVSLVLGVGKDPERTLRAFCEAVGEPPPPLADAPTQLASGEALAWWRGSGRPPVRVRTYPSRAEHSRHSRKYAEGSVGPDRSFRFRGPEEKLNLKAQNLVVFIQLADGVDDATWQHHLRKGDYSRWFRDEIKDDDLASDAEKVEALADAPARETRQAMREAIERRYTLPSEGASGELVRG